MTRVAHEAREIVIKTAEVDIEMIPVVQWLNSFPDVYTRFSCQGSETSTDPTDSAMAIFYCHWADDLNKIAKETKHYAQIEVDNYNGQIRYILQFHCRECFLEFKQNILNGIPNRNTDYMVIRAEKCPKVIAQRAAEKAYDAQFGTKLCPDEPIKVWPDPSEEAQLIARMATEAEPSLPF